MNDLPVLFEVDGEIGIYGYASSAEVALSIVRVYFDDDDLVVEKLPHAYHVVATEAA